MDIYLSGSGTANGFNNDYSTIGATSWTSQGGNVDFDPLFAGNADYHLSSGSGCINAGLNSAPEIPDYDFEDDPRIKDNLVDIGADEFVPTTIPHILLLLLN